MMKHELLPVSILVFFLYGAVQGQLGYMRGLILMHIQKPMTRAQVCLRWPGALLKLLHVVGLL